MTKPLAGVRVLELARVLAGPLAGQLLADLGADVVKIERAGTGDDTRGWGPPFVSAADGSSLDSAYFHSCNRGKRGVAADFETDEGQALVRRLAARADVVIENFKLGGLAKYGLDAQTLTARHPRLVHCSISGFGRTGPKAALAGYDFLVQAMSGAMSVTGEPDGRPMKAGFAMADVFCGLYAANAIQAALVARARTGRGAIIDCALLEAQMAALANLPNQHFATGKPPPRVGNSHASIVPYDVFEASDGAFVIASGTDAQWRKICGIVGRPDLGADPRYARNRDRVERRAEVIAALAAAIAPLERGPLLDALDAASVPAGPIRDLAQAFADPQIVARGLKIEAASPRAPGGSVPGVRAPILIDGAPMAAAAGAPSLGEHQDDVLRDPAWGGGED